ncbi:MAG: hypothetical protein R3C05_03430 [Pirellulaceae bacterium]
MGGAPLLLALAAVTVDYGWQPDDKGGIEYIIQVPPGQLEQSGGFTSRIDPRVRGLVSRVVIRVGDGPLPQDFGDIAPNMPPEALTSIPDADRHVTETQVRQADGDATVVRGQSDNQTSGGFTMPVQATSGIAAQSTANNARNVGNAMPSTTYNPNAYNQNANTNTNTGSTQAGLNYRGIATDSSQASAGQQQTTVGGNDPRNYGATQPTNANNNQAAQTNPGTNGYRDSSWTSTPAQTRAPMPSTAPYASANQANNVASTTNDASNGFYNSGIYDRNNPNAGPTFANDSGNRSPLSTFANPNPNVGQVGNGYNLLSNSTNQGGSHNYNPSPRPDTNLQSVYANGQQQNQPTYNQQQGNAQQPSYANPATQGNGAATGGFVNNPYSYPSVNPGYGYTQPQSNFTVPQYPTGGYNPAVTDPRYAMVPGNAYNQLISGDRTAKDEAEDKASAILIAERERLSTQAIELQRENETLAKAKEALLYDNNTLIAENRVSKDRLQSMSFFQFFLMISFLANLYLIVHLSKLYQRYRDLVTTVRASSASAQPV